MAKKSSKVKSKKDKIKQSLKRIAKSLGCCKCGKCGWIHYAIKRTEAKRQVDGFNKYFKSLSKADRILYYGNTPSSISSYEACFMCNASYKEMIKPEPGDLKKIVGSTIQPIITPEE